MARVSTPMAADLREKLSLLPERPGAYLLKDGQGRVLYVGKAKSLKHRLRAYFEEVGEEDPRLTLLKSRIRDFEYILTQTEMEAFILEANLVKEHGPRYNIRLKDDKSYPYIKVTVNEYFPRAFLTRRVLEDGARYFGPYTHVALMRQNLQLIKKIFPVRPCHYDFPRVEPPKNCIYFQIKRCPGPCYGAIPRQDYLEMVSRVIEVLSGRSSRVVEELERRMLEASRTLDFEQAARYRDQLRALEEAQNRQRVTSLREEDQDVAALVWEEGVACGVIMRVREGKVLGLEHHLLKNLRHASREEILQAFLAQHYARALEVPPLLLLPWDFPDRLLAEAWLAQKARAPVKLAIPERGEKVRLLKLAETNAQALLEEYLHRRDRRREELPLALREVQAALRLATLPRTIIGVDISTIQGTASVGSIVCFRDGLADKDGYRRLRIKSVVGQDDFAMIREVLTRYFRRTLKEETPPPQLLLVDGGKGQLSSALTVLEELGLEEVPAIGLAKGEEWIHLPEESQPLVLPPHSAGLRLLERVRDEAHRFALAYHRQLMERRLPHSVLDEIPGIGPRRKQVLLTTFGSLRGIKRASPEALAKVGGLPRSLAERVWQELHRE